MAHPLSFPHSDERLEYAWQRWDLQVRYTRLKQQRKDQNDWENRSRRCHICYTAVTGKAELRNAIAHELKHRKNLTYNPNTEIAVGKCAKQCVYQGVLATSGPGDTGIVPASYWTSYPEMVALASAESIILGKETCF